MTCSWTIGDKTEAARTHSNRYLLKWLLRALVLLERDLKVATVYNAHVVLQFLPRFLGFLCKDRDVEVRGE